MISIKNKFLFIHIPKTGGNSIQNILHPYSDDDITIHGNIQHNLPPAGLDRFGVHNNGTTLTKHSSLNEYEQFFGSEFNNLLKFATIRNPWDRAVSFYFSPHRGPVQWDENKFINFVADNVLSLRHYLTLQENDNFSLNVDRIIKFENISKDFTLIANQLGIKETELPHKNKANKKHYSYYYNNQTIEFIAENFKEDIKLGNYEYNK